MKKYIIIVFIIILAVGVSFAQHDTVLNRYRDIFLSTETNLKSTDIKDDQYRYGKTYSGISHQDNFYYISFLDNLLQISTDKIYSFIHKIENNKQIFPQQIQKELKRIFSLVLPKGVEDFQPKNPLNNNFIGIDYNPLIVGKGGKFIFRGYLEKDTGIFVVIGKTTTYNTAQFYPYFLRKQDSIKTYTTLLNEYNGFPMGPLGYQKEYTKIYTKGNTITNRLLPLGCQKNNNILYEYRSFSKKNYKKINNNQNYEIRDFHISLQWRDQNVVNTLLGSSPQNPITIEIIIPFSNFVNYETPCQSNISKINIITE